MRIPPISAGRWAKTAVSPGPYRRVRPASIPACKSGGKGAALSTVAVRPAISSLTNRLKCERTAGQSRRPAATRCCTTLRTRFSSSKPFTRQKWNSCLASRLACLLIFMLCRNLLRRLFGQTTLIFRRENLTSHRGGCLHHQPADLALEFGEHAVAFQTGGFACLA